LLIKIHRHRLSWYSALGSSQYEDSASGVSGRLLLVVPIFLLQLPHVLVRCLHVVVADLFQHFLQKRLRHTQFNFHLLNVKFIGWRL